ncbi:hypothetical protein NT06LI_2404 [Listeria innocua FSL J1-023]|nr:hypothetical protein NT06LI_2404 [Listeria innocua FSL J1-023]
MIAFNVIFYTKKFHLDMIFPKKMCTFCYKNDCIVITKKDNRL